MFYYWNAPEEWATEMARTDNDVIIIMPAYNAEKTLERTLAGIPRIYSKVGAGERINLIDFLNQPRPCLATGRWGLIGLYDAGDFVIPVFLLPIAPADITVVAIVPDHLLPTVGNMAAHGSKPFKGGKFFCLFTVFFSSYALPLHHTKNLNLKSGIFHSFFRLKCGCSHRNHGN